MNANVRVQIRILEIKGERQNPPIEIEKHLSFAEGEKRTLNELFSNEFKKLQREYGLDDSDTVRMLIL